MNLSPEIWEKIFSHLDVTSLKSCLLVSKYFRESILNSPTIMKKLPLNLNWRNWESKFEFVKHFGSKIKRVEIMSRDKSGDLMKLLHFTPNAVTVVINWSSRDKIVESMDCVNLAETMEIKLEKLENFKISLLKVNAEVLFRQMLRSVNVKKLCIGCDDETMNECTSMIAFLAKQSKLEELELKFGNCDAIFSEENIRKFNFKLKQFTVIPSNYFENNFEHLSTFLLMQSLSLTELHIFSARCERKIAKSIYNLGNLKRLTTHTILPCFQFRYDKGIVMRSLTHYRYYLGNTNESLQSINPAALPNLRSLNVHFGIDHRLCGANPDEKVIINPLSKLQNLREFHIESHYQNVLRHVASPVLELLATTYEKDLIDKTIWKKMVKNLPKLSTLIVENIHPPFLKVICDFKKCLKKSKLNLLILREQIHYNTVLKCFIRDGKIWKIRGYCWNKWSSLIIEEEELSLLTNDFELTVMDNDEYEKKFEFWNCYFHLCGP